MNQSQVSSKIYKNPFDIKFQQTEKIASIITTRNYLMIKWKYNLKKKSIIKALSMDQSDGSISPDPGGPDTARTCRFYWSVCRASWCPQRGPTVWAHGLLGLPSGGNGHCLYLLRMESCLIIDKSLKNKVKNICI